MKSWKLTREIQLKRQALTGKTKLTREVQLYFKLYSIIVILCTHCKIVIEIDILHCEYSNCAMIIYLLHLGRYVFGLKKLSIQYCKTIEFEQQTFILSFASFGSEFFVCYLNTWYFTTTISHFKTNWVL